MWIGTEEALIKFDGRTSHRYVHDPHDKTSVPHNSVNTIIESKNNELWIGTAQGLCIYNRELDNFVNVDSIPGNRNYLNNRYITDLEFDNYGKLWIGTHEGGINIYDPAKKEFEYIADAPKNGMHPAANFINVLINKGDTIWCGNKGGLALYDARTKARLGLNSLERFEKSQISVIMPDRAGDLWIATIDGQITKLKHEKGSYSFLDVARGNEFGNSPGRVLAMCFDQKGNIFVGGEASGFNIIDGASFKVTRLFAQEENTKRLPTNSIQSLYADDLGFIWVGTPNNGVFVADNNAKKFETIIRTSSDLPSAYVEARSFAEDKHGNVWVALYGSGLGKLNLKKNLLENVPAINNQLASKNVTSVICDKAGNLWVGTAGKGIYKIDPVRSEVRHYSVRSDGFGNDQVFCLYEDTRGTIWAGTWGSGIFYLDASKNQFVSGTEYDKVNHIPNTGYISAFVEDSQGTLWVGTLYGLYELKRKDEKGFSYNVHLPLGEEAGISGPEVQAVVADRKGNLWVGTTDGLSVRMRGSSAFTSFPQARNARANAIRSLLPDKDGNIWIGGNAGLSKLDVNSGIFINYTREDGLKSNNFMRNSALEASTGLFFFGSNNGFDAFHPDSLRSTIPKGKIFLTDLKINNRSVKPGAPESPLQKHISMTSALDLSYDQRSFTIDFAAMNNGQPSGYTYCYMLEGFDETWNCSGANASATYTNIDPGKYVFVLKAANRDGVWIDNPVRLEITIQQVFWKSWWAFFIYVAVLGLFIYFLIKVRVERLKLRNEIALEKFTREQEQKLSESKTHFFTNVAHEFRTPLSLILIPLESLIESTDVPPVLRQRITTAYKNASQMKRLVNELMDFNKLEAGNLKLHVEHGDLIQFIGETSRAFTEMAVKRKIRFAFRAESTFLMGWFDKDKLERIIFNILSNAFKFTADGGEIAVSVSSKQAIVRDGQLCDCIQLRIEDNGIGISADELPHIFEKFYQAKSSFKSSSPGTGIGLSLTKALVELHQGTIKAESTPEKSTIFTIVLPVSAKAYNIDERNDTYSEVVPEKPGVVENVPLPEAVVKPIDTECDDEKPRILVVEDNHELREYIVAELGTTFCVIAARDGEEGLMMAKEELPDLIISDIMMPLKDGIELCHEIKSDLHTCHIPFILLTAKATIEDQIHGVTSGADLYVPKPFNVRYLIAHVNQIIGSRRQLYARFSQDVYLMPGKATSNALDQEFLQKAIDYVVSNLQDTQLGVDSIAGLFNLSRMQVYRKIKALTGKSVVEFIRMVRMKEAIKLMDTHKYTLAEIAFEVGFNSASYFTRRFKEEFGKTPSEYLEQADSGR